MHRHPIVTTPTPLTRLHRLSEAWGADIWIKRDDVAGPSFGGNKARQLEYYFGAAKAEAADTILITGAVQSNFVRTAAAIARSLGMAPIVQLEARVAGSERGYATSGNVLLSRLLGADIRHYPTGEDEAGADAALYALADELRAEGKRPYVIPLGGTHPPLGALGYVDGAHELMRQKDDFDVVVVASGSGATHAGLLAGLAAAGSPARVIGSCVRRPAAAQRTRLAGLLARLAALTPGPAVPERAIHLWDGALAPGYGHAGPAALTAMADLAQSEGLILDPVYTAKSFAAVGALLASGEIARGSRIAFIHTGGLAALFAYEEALRSAFPAP